MNWDKNREITKLAALYELEFDKGENVFLSKEEFTALSAQIKFFDSSHKSTVKLISTHPERGTDYLARLLLPSESIDEWSW